VAVREKRSERELLHCGELFTNPQSLNDAVVRVHTATYPGVSTTEVQVWTRIKLIERIYTDIRNCTFLWFCKKPKSVVVYIRVNPFNQFNPCPIWTSVVPVSQPQLE
jgi:hypothetical protein